MAEQARSAEIARAKPLGRGLTLQIRSSQDLADRVDRLYRDMSLAKRTLFLMHSDHDPMSAEVAAATERYRAAFARLTEANEEVEKVLASFR